MVGHPLQIFLQLSRKKQKMPNITFTSHGARVYMVNRSGETTNSGLVWKMRWRKRLRASRRLARRARYTHRNKFGCTRNIGLETANRVPDFGRPPTYGRRWGEAVFNILCSRLVAMKYWVDGWDEKAFRVLVNVGLLWFELAGPRGLKGILQRFSIKSLI